MNLRLRIRWDGQYGWDGEPGIACFLMDTEADCCLMYTYCDSILAEIIVGHMEPLGVEIVRDQLPNAIKPEPPAPMAEAGREL